MKKSKKLLPFILLSFIALNVLACYNNNTEGNYGRSTKMEIQEQDIINWPPGLGESQILEFEENPLARNYLIVLDGSGSMGVKKMDIAKAALLTFIELIPDEDNIGLVVFDQAGTSERVPLGKDRVLLRNEINSVISDKYTPLKRAISLAYQSLKAQGQRQLGYGEYNLIIVTDGDASAGEDPTNIVNQILNESPVTIHTIGFYINNRHVLNQPGRIVYKSAYNQDELEAGLESVLAESESFIDDSVFEEESEIK